MLGKSKRDIKAKSPHIADRNKSLNMEETLNHTSCKNQ